MADSSKPPSRSGVSCWRTATACSARSRMRRTLVQETYLRAWRSYGGFEGRSSVRTWLYQIATNRCLTELARQQPAGAARPASATRNRIRMRVLEPGGTGVRWLQPAPDAMVLPESADPAVVVAARAAVRLALVASLAVPPAEAAGGAAPAGRAGVPGRRGRRHARHHDGVGQECAAARPGAAGRPGPGRCPDRRADRAARPRATRPVHRRVRERRRRRAGAAPAGGRHPGGDTVAHLVRRPPASASRSCATTCWARPATGACWPPAPTGSPPPRPTSATSTGTTSRTESACSP